MGAGRTCFFLFAALVGCTASKSSVDGGPPIDPSGQVDSGASLPLGGGDWTQYRFEPSGSWHNPGSVTVAQAARTEFAWKAELGEYGWTQPVIAGGSVYATMGYSGKILALDAADGRERWHRELNYVFTDACSTEEKHHGFYSAPTVSGDTVYAASPDGTLYALSTADGSTRWETQVADPTNHAEFVQSSPSVSAALGKVFLGVGSSFHCDPVAGRVLSVDLSSHQALQHPFHPSGAPGASVWSSISVDESHRRIFATTGDPAGTPLSQVPFAQSFVSLNADTLEVLDHWQDPAPGPADNSDFGASPTLFTDSTGTLLVAAPNKDGWLYALDQEHLSSGPVWKLQIAAGGDPMKGEGSLVAPTFAHGSLFAAGGRTLQGEPGSVVALDPASGAVRWKHATPGFVLASMPAVGDVLVVASSKADYSESWLELLDRDSGRVVKTFGAPVATLAAPSVGRGLILWMLYSGELRAYRIPAD